MCDQIKRRFATYFYFKAENAASFGCKGLGIFMDPSTVAQVWNKI